MAQILEEDKKEFQAQFYKIVETNSVKEVEFFLLSSKFKEFSQEYRQSVMDYLVCSGYENEELAKWSLTNNSIGMRGNIHESADRPLRLASAKNTEFAKYLLTAPELSEKADINSTNDGSSAILNAIVTKNLEFVKYLTTSPDLEVLARIDIADKDFNDPLCRACDEDALEIVKYLLSDECYPDKKVFSPIKNIAQFEYGSIRKIIANDNEELLKFIVDNKFLDIKKDLHNWFCSAVMYDSTKIASYLEQFFEPTLDLTKLKYKNKSLFFAVAEANHYSQKHNHSYFNSLLEQMASTLTPQELKEMNHFYVYPEHDSPKRLLDIIDIYREKDKIDETIVSKNIKKEISKI